MKKTAVVILAVVALAATGCKKKEEAPQGMAPQGGMPAQQMPAGMPPQGGAPGAPGANPHAGLKPVEVPAGSGHKGKVLETMNSGGYTYAQVDEKGQKVWVATMETKVNVGDTIEFPDTNPVPNFQSKTLNRTFDKLFMVPGIRVSK